MKVSVITNEANSLGVAYHLSSEGHDVTMVTPYSHGAGLVNITTSLEFPIDLVMFDRFGSGVEADNLRRKGNMVLGPSRWSDMLEEDAGYRNSIIQAVGWPQGGVDSGTHLYVSVWFNGVTFISTYASLLYRRFMSGGTGPDIGGSGIVSDFSQPTDLICEAVLKPLQPVLSKVSYKGCMHIHLVVDKSRFCVKEIFTNMAHPLTLLQYENGKSSVSNTLLRLLDITSHPIPPINRWAVGVLLSVPPFPNNSHSQEVAINGIADAAIKHLWLCDVKRDGNNWSTSGVNGKIGWVTARGTTPYEASRRVYRTIENIKAQNLQYRYDIGTMNIYSLFDKLSTGGWIKPVPKPERYHGK